MRTTKAKLASLLARINVCMGIEPPTDQMPAWKQVGRYTLDHNATYGGWQLEKNAKGGGVHTVSPRMPAQWMADYLRAFLAGIEAERSRVRNRKIKDH